MAWRRKGFDSPRVHSSSRSAEAGGVLLWMSRTAGRHGHNETTKLTAVDNAKRYHSIVEIRCIHWAAVAVYTASIAVMLSLSESQTALEMSACGGCHR